MREAKSHGLMAHRLDFGGWDVSTLIAYNLQAGAYIEDVHKTICL